MQRPCSTLKQQADPKPAGKPAQQQLTVKDLERQLHMARQENEDLRVNLRINKESLQALLNEKKAPPDEGAMIKTINVISSENIKL